MINEGVGFGLEFPWWAVVIVLVLVGGIWWRKRWRVGIGEALIVVGGVSNGIERITRGHIVDRFKMAYIPLWFNVADVCIIIGLLWSLKSSLKTTN